MPAAVEFSSLAAAGLAKAQTWYELQRPGLGAGLLSEVARAVESIASHPNIGVAVRREVRRIVLRRFPYELLYAVESDRMLILSIRHYRRARR